MARYYVSITLLVYLLALCFVAVRLEGDGSMLSLQILLLGPWGIVMGLFGWFANPLLGLAVLLRRRLRWLSLALGGWALYLALACLNIDTLPDNHSYNFLAVTRFDAGYYLWALAIAIFCAGQAWWCGRGRSIEVPRWHWADAGLGLLLVAVVVIASQQESLHFKVERVFDMPPPIEAPRRDEAI